MHQWKVILATVLIFGSGVGTGHFLSLRNAPEQPAPQPKNSDGKFSPANSNTKGFQPPSARPMMFRSHGYLDNHLKLTDEQKVQLREVRKAGHDRVREFGKPFRERIIAEDQRVREEIRTLLTPEQARTFDRLPHFRINPEPGRPGAGRQPRTNGPHPPRPNPKAKKPVPASPQTTGQVQAKAA
jgi:Spy/CpxP family protein refolding chaperone